jgi:hypothetical protein
MWQTKYALAVPKNLGSVLNFWLCSESNFFSGRPYSVDGAIVTFAKNDVSAFCAFLKV